MQSAWRRLLLGALKLIVAVVVSASQVVVVRLRAATPLGGQRRSSAESAPCVHILIIVDARNAGLARVASTGLVVLHGGSLLARRKLQGSVLGEKVC